MITFDAAFDIATATYDRALSLRQLAAVILLGRHPQGIGCRDLATRLHCTPSSVTVMLRRKEMRDLVHRPDTGGEVCKLAPLTLTAEGRTLFRQLCARSAATTVKQP